MKTVIKEIIECALDKAKRAGELELGNAPDVVIEKPKDEKYPFNLKYSTALNIL